MALTVDAKYRKKIDNNNNNNNRDYRELKGKKNKYFCTNCGKNGHEYRECTQPTTSWGIILVNINSEIKIKHELKPPARIYSSLGEYEPYTSKASITDDTRFLCGAILECITFLLISRKHSLGYVEFIRGRYHVEKPMQLSYLFKLMTKEEISKIKHSLTLVDGFEYLWVDLWGKKADNPQMEQNKKESKSKYNILKYIGVDGPEIGLEFMVNEITAQYDINEWGFPKGRRMRNESDKDCAIREFMEESGYKEEDFKIIDEIEPIVEEFFGTNGVKYRHVYYVAELVAKKIPQNNLTEFQNDEVGEITFMNLNMAVHTIRPYHIEKINLLTSLAHYYFDVVYKAAQNIIK